MQSRSLPLALTLALAAAAVGGLVGALVTAAVLPEPTPSHVPVSATVAPTGEPRSEGLAELRRAVETLSARLDVLEAAPASAPRLPADLVTRAELEALREQLDEARGGVASAPLPDDAALRESVEATLRVVEKERAVTRLEKGLADQRASLDERVERYGDWLELDGYQRDHLREALLEKSERDAELLRQWAEGGDEEVLSETKRRNAEDFGTRVEALLRPDQLQRYRERTAK